MLSAALSLALLACAPRPVGARPVTTPQGLAEGVTRDGITAWLGIEYARAERWALPVPAPARAGTRRLDTLGPACPQEGQAKMVEDCLFLNVFAPEGAGPSAPLPVLVWIHGGGFRAGEGGEEMGALAREDVVVVSFNYRLGLLGFHDWPGWTSDQPRNFGQADMVAALRWVQSNIAAFGGDADNVTLLGHSAGGMGVQLMMIDPRARGLFHRAIAHAGYGTWPFPRIAEARKGGPPLQTDASPAELVARVPHYHLPFVGGVDLPEQPSDVFVAGGQASVPYVAGANSYDGFGTIDGAGFGVDGILARYGDDTAVREAYAADFAVSDAQAMTRLFGDMRYAHAAWVTVRAMEKVGQPGFLFSYAAPTKGLPGAEHGDQYGALVGTDPFPLRAAWLAFAKTGSPDADGLPPWPAHTASSSKWMVFSPDAEVVDGLLAERMRVIDALAFPEP